MANGASIKFTTYEESVPKLLKILGIGRQLKKYDRIVLKPFVRDLDSPYTEPKFVEQVLKFVLENKNPVSEVFIAEGSDGHDTLELFESLGYKTLAEKYSIGLIDLNNTELEEVSKPQYTRFESVQYPTILKDACVLSLPVLDHDLEVDVIDSLSNMIGAYPASIYSSFFSKKKSKMKRSPLYHSTHDIAITKIPEFSIIDASEFGYILAGLPLDIDKQASKLLKIDDWKTIPHLKAIDQSLTQIKERKKNKEEEVLIE